MTFRPLPVNIPVTMSALISPKGIAKFGSFYHNYFNTAVPTYITVHYVGTIKMKQVFCFSVQVPHTAL